MQKLHATAAISGDVATIDHPFSIAQQETLNYCFARFEILTAPATMNLKISSHLRMFFIEKTSLGNTLSNQTALFTDGHVDSIDLADLIAFVCNEFDVTIPPSGFTVENLDTIENQARYIQSLLEKNRAA